MKRKNILLTFLVSTLLLGACNQAPSSENSSSDIISSETSSSSEESKPYDPEKWNANAKSVMNKELHELLPYIELGSYDVLTSLNQRNETVVHVLQNNAPDNGLTSKYETYIKECNYVFSSENAGFKTYEKVSADKSKIQMTFGYFNGNDDVKPGFQINASYIIPLSYVSAWTHEEKALINEKLHEMIPCPTLTNKHETVYDEDFKAIVVKDMYANTKMMDDYLKVLLANGFVANGDDSGFFTYDKEANDDEAYIISIDPYDYNKYGAVGIELYIKRIKNTKVSDSWPSDDLNAYFKNDAVIKTIPAYTDADKYIYFHKDGMFSIKCLSTPELFQAYMNKFIPLGFSVGYVESLNTYRVISSDQSVILLIVFTNNASYPELSIEIYKR